MWLLKSLHMWNRLCDTEHRAIGVVFIRWQFCVYEISRKIVLHVTGLLFKSIDYLSLGYTAILALCVGL